MLNSNKPTLSFAQRRSTALPELTGSPFRKKDLQLLSQTSQRDSQEKPQLLAQLLREGLPSSVRSNQQPKVASTGQRATPLN